MRAFRLMCTPSNLKALPPKKSLQRLVDRFEREAAVRAVISSGPTPVSPEDISKMEDYFTNNQEVHISQAVVDIGLSNRHGKS